MESGAHSYFQIHCSAGKNTFVPATVSMGGGVVCDADNTIDHCDQNTKKRPRRVTAVKKLKKEVKTSDDIEDINFSTDEAVKIRASLLKWYDENQRDLPWRRISKHGGNNRDDMDNEGVEESERRAYAVWVSEVMLQQTRVQTVIDYFNRWMNKWPTLHHLAQASLEEVNEMWAGLGYYRRARFLLEGAKMIVGEGSGFPKGVSALRKVKGIGDYTAGAIASIAFREVVPVVDGNVVRVIARLKAISRNPKDTVTIKKMWNLAGQLVDDYRPGDFNQALMELGATVCAPLSPSCSVCPILTQCCALSLSRHHESVQVTDYPIKVVKAKQRHQFAAVSVVEILEGQDRHLQSNSKFLLVRRADEGLLAGLWEFPSVLLEGEADLTVRRKATNQFLKTFNLVPQKSCNIILREDVGEYVHVFSHIRLKMYVELIVLQLKGLKNLRNKKQDEDKDEDIKWKYVDKQALSSMGLTSGVRKVYSMIENHKQSKLSSISAKARPRKASRNQSIALNGKR